MHKGILFSLFVVIFFLFGALSTSAQTSCNAYPSGSTPPAEYGTSWNQFTGAHELLLRLVECSGTDAEFYAGMPNGGTNASLYAVWGKGYRYTGSEWQELMLAPASDSTKNGEWIFGRAGIALSGLTANRTYLAAYVCYNQSGWKCGCKNTSCTARHWQLQAHVGSDGGGEGLRSGIGVPLAIGGPGNRPYRAGSPAYMTVRVEKIDSPLTAISWNNRYDHAQGNVGYSSGDGGEISVRVRKATISGDTLNPGTILGETDRISSPTVASSFNVHWQRAGGSGSAPSEFAQNPTVRFQSPIDLASAGVQVGDLLAFEFVQHTASEFVSINGMHAEPWAAGTPRSFGGIYDDYRWFRSLNDEDERKVSVILLGYQDGAVKGQPWMGLDGDYVSAEDLIGNQRIREVIPIQQSGKPARSLHTVMVRPSSNTTDPLVIELRKAGSNPGSATDEGTLLCSGSVPASSVTEATNIKHHATRLNILSVTCPSSVALEVGSVYYVVARSGGSSTAYRFRQLHRFLNQPDHGLKIPDFLRGGVFRGQYNPGSGWKEMVAGKGFPANDAPLWIGF